MKNYTFNWEVQTLLEQFVGAFNDVIIKRYDHNNNQVAPLSGDKVLFVYSPKQRVYSNLNSPAAGGLTVPVIAVNITGIQRDNNRVFNKNEGFRVDYEAKDGSGSYIKNIPQPVPVNIGVEMTIISRYQSDMDQILTNFIPYCDPYIVISWKLPSLTHSTIPYELRNEILWSGNINLQYPDNLTGTQPYRITATTSFTIKGWMFKKMDELFKKIYTINTQYSTTDGVTIDNTSTSTPSLFSNFETVFGNIPVIATGSGISQTDLSNFRSTFSTVTEVSGDWEYSYEWVKNNETNANNWNAVYSQVLANSSQWGGSIPVSIQYISGNWNSTYSTVNNLSSNWGDTYSIVSKNSALWIAGGNSIQLQQLSGTWNSTYNTVLNNSATTWNYQGTDIKSLTSNWIGGNEAYTNLLSNSSSYLSSVDLSFLSVSSNWNTAYNISNIYQNTSSSFATNITLNSVSSILTPLTTTSTLTGLLLKITDFNNYQTNVASSTASLLPILIYQNTSGSFVPNIAINSLTGNWNSAYTNISNLSTAYGSVTAVNGTIYQIQAINNNGVVVLSVPNSFRTPGDLNVGGNLYVAGSGVILTTSTLTVSSPIIYINNSLSGGSGNVFDIGFVGHFNNGMYQHTGLVRSAQNNYWSLFSGLTSEPSDSATLNYNNPTFTIDTLRANILGSLSGNVKGNLTGNADTVTNGVYTNGSYSDPSWITSLADSKITGNSRNKWDSVYSTYNNASSTFLTNTNFLTAYTNNTVLSSLTSTFLTNTNFLTAYTNNTVLSSLTGSLLSISIYQNASANWQNASDSLDFIIVNSNFNAFVNRQYLIDTTISTVNGILPASPTIGDNISFVDAYNTWGVKPLIINNNGNLLQTYNEALTANISGYQFKLVYIGGSYGWKIV